MMRRLAILFAMSGLLFADDEIKQKMEVAHTERVAFPTGGQLRLKNSIGELTVEGWDWPDVEITTVKSTKDEYTSTGREKASHELDKVRVSVTPQGSDLVIATDFPRHRGMLPTWRKRPVSTFDLEYRIKAPMNAKLAVDHVAGEVHVDNLASDIRATVRNGAITLQLPPDGQYDIDAKACIGEVVSDYPGHKNRKHLFGHSFIQGTKATHNLYLRVGFGDIIVFKSRKPPVPTPATVGS